MFIPKLEINIFCLTTSNEYFLFQLNFVPLPHVHFPSVFNPKFALIMQFQSNINKSLKILITVNEIFKIKN